MTWVDVGQMLRSGGMLHGLFSSLFGGGGKQETAEKTAEGIKAGTLGIGKNDEALFWDAVALSLQGETEKDLRTKSRKIRDIFARLNHGQKCRLYQIVGINEQDIIRTEPTSTREHADTKGNIKYKVGEKKESLKVNERGKRLIQILVCLDTNTAVSLLEASGTLAGPADDLKYFWQETIQPFLNRITDADVEKQARKLILGYLGATTLQDAETRVTAKRLALEIRQQQPWYDRRNLHDRNVMLITWLVLAIFSIAGLTFVFAFSH